jgi:hypothetical protein
MKRRILILLAPKWSAPAAVLMLKHVQDRLLAKEEDLFLSKEEDLFLSQSATSSQAHLRLALLVTLLEMIMMI